MPWGKRERIIEDCSSPLSVRASVFAARFRLVFDEGERVSFTIGQSAGTFATSIWGMERRSSGSRSNDTLGSFRCSTNVRWVYRLYGNDKDRKARNLGERSAWQNPRRFHASFYRLPPSFYDSRTLVPPSKFPRVFPRNACAQTARTCTRAARRSRETFREPCKTIAKPKYHSRISHPLPPRFAKLGQSQLSVRRFRHKSSGRDVQRRARALARKSRYFRSTLTQAWRNKNWRIPPRLKISPSRGEHRPVWRNNRSGRIIFAP